MAMFPSLEIKNFRAFDHLKIERLGQVNLIIGQNNVGKSTLLEAVWLLANVGAPLVIKNILRSRDEIRDTRFGDRENQNTEESADDIIKKLFFAPIPSVPDRDRNWILQIGPCGLKKSTLMLELLEEPYMGVYKNLQATPSDERDGMSFQPSESADNDFQTVLSIAYNSSHGKFSLERFFRNYPRPLRMMESELAQHCQRCFFIESSNKKDITRQEILWEQVLLTDAKQLIIDALRIIAPNVEDIAMIPYGRDYSILVKIKGQSPPVPAKRLGDGMNWLLEIGMALTCAKEGILLIDEIENGIHWTVLPEMWEWIGCLAKLWNIQVFATTHSNDCLKALYKGAIMKADVESYAIRLEKIKDKFYSEIFDAKLLSTIVRDGGEIR